MLRNLIFILFCVSGWSVTAFGASNSTVSCEELLREASTDVLHLHDSSEIAKIRRLTLGELKEKLELVSRQDLTLGARSFLLNRSREVSRESEIDRTVVMLFDILVPVRTTGRNGEQETRWIRLELADPNAVLHAETLIKIEDTFGELGEGFLYMRRGILEYWKEKDSIELSYRFLNRVENGSSTRELTLEDEGTIRIK